MMKNNLTLEQAFAELEKIVTKLENNNNSIEEVIDLFKKGNELSEICKNKLHKAELLVSKTTKKNKK